MLVKHKHTSMADYNCVLTLLLLTFLGLTVAAVTVEVGGDVTLECPLSGDFPAWFGPPPDTTALTSNNAVTADGMEYVNDKDLRMLSVMTSHAGVYTCKTGSSEATVELVVNSFDYKIKFLNEHDLSSQSNMIDSDYNMFIAAWDGRNSNFHDSNDPRKGTDHTVTCVVENAFPEPHVVVEFLDETRLTITDTISSSDLLADNTYTVTAYVNVTFSKKLNEREVRCVARSGNKSVRKQSRVRIVFPPSSVSLPGPVKAVRGQDATLTCTASLASYGKSTSGVEFRWTMSGEYINVTQVSYALEPGQYDGFKTTQTVTFPVTEDMDGAEVTCVADNDAGYTFGPRASTTIDIQYAPVIVRPFQNVIHGYKGVGLNMICVVDSKPVSNITWYSVYEKAQKRISLETSSVENNKLPAYLTYHYRMPGMFYRCVADNGIEPVASKDIKVNLRDKPMDPVIEFTSVKADSMIVTINEWHTRINVPRLLYVQYRPDGAPDNAWVEAGYGTLDTEVDNGLLYPNAVYLHNLLPDTLYNVRLRIEDIGFSYYSENYKRIRTTGDEMKSQSEYRNAILISVFVTFGVMLIILIVAVVLVKNGKCGGAKRSDTYIM